MDQMANIQLTTMASFLVVKREVIHRRMHTKFILPLENFEIIMFGHLNFYLYTKWILHVPSQSYESTPSPSSARRRLHVRCMERQ